MLLLLPNLCIDDIDPFGQAQLPERDFWEAYELVRDLDGEIVPEMEAEYELFLESLMDAMDLI